jgi:hypothetical protein
MRADIMVDIGRVRMAQQDGGAPTTLAAGSAPGESGVSVSVSASTAACIC